MNAPSAEPAVSAPGGTFRCSTAARWIPVALAGAMLLGAVVLAVRIDPDRRLPGAGAMRVLLVAAAAVLGMRISLSLRELGLRLRFRSEGVLFELRGRSLTLDYGEVRHLDWDPAFRHYAKWLPALVLVDRRARRHRVPALLEEGDRFVLEFVSRSGRTDLADWVEVHRIAGRMARARSWVVLFFAAAACAVAAAAVVPLR